MLPVPKLFAKLPQTMMMETNFMTTHGMPIKPFSNTLLIKTNKVREDLFYEATQIQYRDVKVGQLDKMSFHFSSLSGETLWGLRSGAQDQKKYETHVVLHFLPTHETQYDDIGEVEPVTTTPVSGENITIYDVGRLGGFDAPGSNIFNDYILSEQALKKNNEEVKARVREAKLAQQVAAARAEERNAVTTLEVAAEDVEVEEADEVEVEETEMETDNADGTVGGDSTSEPTSMASEANPTPTTTTSTTET